MYYIKAIVKLLMMKYCTGICHLQEMKFKNETVLSKYKPISKGTSIMFPFAQASNGASVITLPINNK